MNNKNGGIQLAKGLAGAIVGAVIGSIVFYFLWSKFNIYAGVLPGAITGIVCSYASRIYSPILGIACVVMGLIGTFLAQPRFAKDDSLMFLANNFFATPTSQLVMIAIGLATAYYFGQGQDYFGKKD